MKSVRPGNFAISLGLVAASLATPVVSSPLISELFYDASGSDAGLTFVELFGAPGESLDGMTLEGVNGSNGAVYTSLALSGLIPADGVFVIGDDDGGATAVGNADMIGNVDYQNGPDSVVLRLGGSVLDAVGYGSFAVDDIFAGEGSPAPDPAAGSSLARLNPLLDSDNNALDFSELELPTPGTVPSASPVPLPAAFWLLGSGLLGMIATARRR